MAMIGLTYVGNKPRGIRIQLYKSYKTVVIAPGKNYVFTPRDQVSSEAKDYYDALYNLGVLAVNEGELSKEDLEPEKEVVAKVEEEPVESPIADAEGDDPTESIPDLDTSEVAQSTKDPEVNFSEMADSDLGEYLEANLSRGDIKSLISEIDSEYDIGKKSASTLISYLIENHKDELVEKLSK